MLNQRGRRDIMFNHMLGHSLQHCNKELATYRLTTSGSWHWQLQLENYTLIKSMNCTYTCCTTTQPDISPYKALQGRRTGNTNPTWTTALNSHSPWACWLVAFPLPIRGEGLFDLQYLLSLWMYVECKDVCNNFRSKHKTCRLNILFGMVTLVFQIYAHSIYKMSSIKTE